MLLVDNPFETSIAEQGINCKNCSTHYSAHECCLDLAINGLDEKNFYEEKQKEKVPIKKSLNLSQDLDKLHKLWSIPFLPERAIFLKELMKNEIEDKSILLLGNGDSIKELYLLGLGTKLIYSDLSFNAIKNVNSMVNFAGYENKVLLCSVNANNIPFADESVDIILGYAFVHHIDDLDTFFMEISRVLKPGGRCLFLDNAYSHFWQKIKLASWPIIYYLSQRRWGGISPQDKKYMVRGGYHLKELEIIKKKYNFSEITFVRFSFFAYFFYRFTEILFGYGSIVSIIDELIIPILFVIDNRLSKWSNTFYNNTMYLVWGFKK